MELLMAVLCDTAHVRDGLLSVIGAGLSQSVAPSFPAPLGANGAVMLMLDPAESGRPVVLEVIFDGPSGEFERVRVDIDTMGSEGLSVVPIVLPIAGVELPEPGGYAIEFVVDGQPRVTLGLLASVGG